MGRAIRRDRDGRWALNSHGSTRGVRGEEESLVDGAGWVLLHASQFDEVVEWVDSAFCATRVARAGIDSVRLDGAFEAITVELRTRPR